MRCGRTRAQCYPEEKEQRAPAKNVVLCSTLDSRPQRTSPSQNLGVDAPYLDHIGLKFEEEEQQQLLHF